MLRRSVATVLLLSLLLVISASAQKKSFKAIVLAERKAPHEPFVAAALQWLDTFAREQHFTFTVINEPQQLDSMNWSDYRLFIQLNYPPYRWSDSSMHSFIKYITEGQGGWVGFHHASLLGEFDGFSMWQWFSDFMGGIRFKNYIAEKASATVHVEKRDHPVMRSLPDSFTIPDDEWYVFDRNPRPNVSVLASVDEASYEPPSSIKMGDHPVIWSNEKMKARNVYFLIGHSASLLQCAPFRKMFANAILWAAGQKVKDK